MHSQANERQKRTFFSPYGIFVQTNAINFYFFLLFSCIDQVCYQQIHNQTDIQTLSSSSSIQMTFVHQRRQTPSPNILLVTLPDDQHRPYRIHREKKPQVPTVVGCQVTNLDLHDTSGWQRSSDKIRRLSAAPDVAYRLTYLQGSSRTKSAKTRPIPVLPSRPKVTQSFSYYPSEERPPRTIYDYILRSIRQNDKERNFQEPSLSCFRVERPQNEDLTFRRVLKDRRPSAKTNYSSSSSATHANLRSPQSFVNYINHSRGYQSPTTSMVFQN